MGAGYAEVQPPASTITEKERQQMKRLWQLIVAFALVCTGSFAQDVWSVVHGTVKKVDKASKTVVVKTTDGTEHAIKVTDQATVHGTKEGFDGLKEGSEVVARTTAKGS